MSQLLHWGRGMGEGEPECWYGLVLLGINYCIAVYWPAGLSFLQRGLLVDGVILRIKGKELHAVCAFLITAMSQSTMVWAPSGILPVASRRRPAKLVVASFCIRVPETIPIYTCRFPSSLMTPLPFTSSIAHAQGRR